MDKKVRQSVKHNSSKQALTLEQLSNMKGYNPEEKVAQFLINNPL
jgi:hypothetical protein